MLGRDWAEGLLLDHSQSGVGTPDHSFCGLRTGDPSRTSWWGKGCSEVPPEPLPALASPIVSCLLMAPVNVWILQSSRQRKVRSPGVLGGRVHPPRSPQRGLG